MRINIEIDEKLMTEALRSSGLKSTKDAVELGLKTLVRLNKQAAIKQFRGQLDWAGTLGDLRSDSIA